MTSNDNGTHEAEEPMEDYDTWDLIKCGTPSIYRATRVGVNRLYALDFGSGKIIYPRPELKEFGRMLERLATTGRA